MTKKKRERKEAQNPNPKPVPKLCRICENDVEALEISSVDTELEKSILTANGERNVEKLILTLCAPCLFNLGTLINQLAVSGKLAKLLATSKIQSGPPQKKILTPQDAGRVVPIFDPRKVPR